MARWFKFFSFFYIYFGREGGSSKRGNTSCSKELHLIFFQRESPKLQGLKQMYFPLGLNPRQLEIRICMS